MQLAYFAWEGWSNNFDSCCSYFAIPLFVEALRLRGVLRSAWKKREHEDYKNQQVTSIALEDSALNGCLLP
jgi:hypothetical protein